MTNDIWPKLPPGTGKYLALGVEFIAIFGVFLGLGILLDQHVKTRVVFTLIGMALGFAGGMYRLLRVSREHWKSQDGPPKA